MDEITIDLRGTTLRDFVLSENDGEYVVELSLDGTVSDIDDIDEFDEPGDLRPVSIQLEVPGDDAR